MSRRPRYVSPYKRTPPIKLGRVFAGEAGDELGLPEVEPESDRRCKWFLLCDRPATTSRSHPTLGTVPVCAKCAAFVDRS